MRKALIGSLIFLMLSIIYVPTPKANAGALPLPVVKAGAEALKEELKVIVGGAAVKQGVKAADKSALARAEENWFSRLNTEEVKILEDALQTKVPAAEKPGFWKIGVSAALMLSGADFYLQVSDYVNNKMPIDRNTKKLQSMDFVKSYKGYIITSLGSSGTAPNNYHYMGILAPDGSYAKNTGGFDINLRNTFTNEDVDGIVKEGLPYKERLEFYLAVQPYDSTKDLVSWYAQRIYGDNSLGPISAHANFYVPTSIAPDQSYYVTYTETPQTFSFTPTDLSQEVYPNPDPAKANDRSQDVVYIYVPDPAANPDIDQAILDNKDTVLAPAAPPVTEPEPSPSTDPGTSPEPTTDPGTNPGTGTDSNAGLFDWLKNAWANLMDWLNSFWQTFRNMLTDLFVPSAAIDTSPIRNVWTDKFPAINNITSALGGLTTLNYDQTPPVWKITLQGKQYVIIDLSTVPSGWMAMARNFMRIWIWSGLLFMILREWRPKPQIG